MDTCEKCGKPSDHFNHYADYSMDGSMWHNADHEFVAKRNQRTFVIFTVYAILGLILLCTMGFFAAQFLTK